MATNTFEKDVFLQALRQVAVGGLINECVAICKGNTLYLRAIDNSQTLFVTVTQNVLGIESILGKEIGLTGISTIIQFMEGADALKVETKDGKIVLKRTDGILTIQTVEVSEISTRVPQPVYAEKKMLEDTDVSMIITADFVSGLSNYLSLVACDLLSFSVEKERVVVRGTGTNGRDAFVFATKIKADTKEQGDCSTTIYNAPLLRALSVLKAYGGDDQIRWKKNNPLIIVKDPKNFWAITSLKAE